MFTWDPFVFFLSISLLFKNCLRVRDLKSVINQRLRVETPLLSIIGKLEERERAQEGIVKSTFCYNGCVMYYKNISSIYTTTNSNI